MATKRKINVTPKSAKPETTPPAAKAVKASAKDIKGKAAKSKDAPAVKAKPGRTKTDPKVRSVNKIARDAQGITEARYGFAAMSDRDEAFCAMLVDCGADKSPVSLEAIAAKYQRNPFYAGSAKSTDVGAMTRLVKAGVAVFDTGNRTIRLNAQGAGVGKRVLSVSGAK